MTEEPTPPAPLPEGKGEKPLAASRAVRTSREAASGSRASSSPFPSGRGAGGVGSSLRRLHVLALLVFLGLWTWKLLEPNPVPEAVSAWLPGEWRFGAAKSLHVGAYAFLTVLAVSLPVSGYWRWFVVGLLALHGVATEIGQTFVPGRGGSARDVLSDWAGVGLGVLCWFFLSGGRKPPV